MRTIIQQIIAGAVEKYLEYYERNGITELSGMTKDFKAISDEMAREMLRVFIDTADQALCEAKAERKADGVKIHERAVPRELYTALGPLRYNRTYFNTPDGMCHLLDGLLGVAAYDRIDSGVSAELVNLAAVHSYGRSADIATGGDISRQSVRNKAMNTGEVVYLPTRVEESPGSIHIFADEDHVNLQSGGNTVVPLITVCEGKRVVCKDRHELIAPFHIHGYGMKPDDLWGYAYALCAEKYDMSLVKEVYVYGDGASWISRHADVFPGAIHVMDVFHFKKRMKSLFAGEICQAHMLSANAAIGRNDKDAFSRIVRVLLREVGESMPAGKTRENKLKAITDSGGYILGHWDAIQNIRLPGSIGSCTEAMVSHVLSARLSRNPMGWSEGGISKISMLRVYVLNGGRVEPVDTLAWKRNPMRHRVVENIERYDRIIKRQSDEVLKDARNWRWFEGENMISGKTTGTKVALDALGRIRKVS